MNKKTIGEIKVGEFTNTLVMDNTSYNEAGKRITIKTQFKGLIQAIEALVPENTTINYSKDSLDFSVEGNIITIVLDSHLNLNVLLTAKIQGNEVATIKKIGWLNVFVSNNTEEIINFLESFIEYLPNGKSIVLENENAGFKLIEEMLNNEEESGEQEKVEAIEDAEVTDKCSICGNDISDSAIWNGGHDAWPVTDGRCCDVCNEVYVIPARIKGVKEVGEVSHDKGVFQPGQIYEVDGKVFNISKVTEKSVWVGLGRHGTASRKVKKIDNDGTEYAETGFDRTIFAQEEFLLKEEENNIMDNISEEKVLKEEIIKIVQEAYEKGTQDAQEELQNKEYLSYKDVTAVYNISRNTINKWVELGLPMYKIDKIQFIKRSEIESFIDSHQVT